MNTQFDIAFMHVVVRETPEYVSGRDDLFRYTLRANSDEDALIFVLEELDRLYKGDEVGDLLDAVVKFFPTQENHRQFGFSCELYEPQSWKYLTTHFFNVMQGE